MTAYHAPLGAPIWIDLATSDLERATDFYARVFGWTFASPGDGYGGYLNASKDGGLVAGLMANEPSRPDVWTTYLHTADVATTVAKAEAAGGSSCMPAMEVPGKGFMGVLTDAVGATFGLWQPTGHPGFTAIGEPGTPVWHQLTTANYAPALDFYREVFGWQTQTESDTDEFRYATAVFGGEQLLGVMDGSVLSGAVPSQWTCFLGAQDVDATIQTVVDNGGSVLRAAEDTPYGRLAAAADPTGATFNLSSV